MLWNKKTKLDVNKPVRNKITMEQYTRVVLEGKMAYCVAKDSSGKDRMNMIAASLLENYTIVPTYVSVNVRLVDCGDGKYIVANEDEIVKKGKVIAIKKVDFEVVS